MAKPAIFVTRPLLPPVREELAYSFEIRENTEDHPLSSEQIAALAKGCVALLPFLTERIDALVIQQLPTLRVISNYAVGVDNIDVAAATRSKVAVCCTPGVLTEATADLTWALLLAAARRVAEGDRYIRNGNFKRWDPSLLLGAELHDKTLGIIGFGRIGQAVARRGEGFGMRIVYYGRSRKTSPETALRAEFLDLGQLLSQSDFVSLHLPLNRETHHLLNRDRLKLIKRTAIVINTSRGALIDEKALVEALRRREIAGAGLDVFEDEPRLAPGLIELENTVLTPHIGSATQGVRVKMGLLAARNATAVLRGERPETIINPEVFCGC